MLRDSERPKPKKADSFLRKLKKLVTFCFKDFEIISTFLCVISYLPKKRFDFKYYFLQEYNIEQSNVCLRNP